MSIPNVSELRAMAWVTRRARYGPQGHAGAYTRPNRADPVGRAALALVIRLHHEETLSEGQCCKALGLDRVAFRRLCDDRERVGTREATPDVELGPGRNPS